MKCIESNMHCYDGFNTALGIKTKQLLPAAECRKTTQFLDLRPQLWTFSILPCQGDIFATVEHPMDSIPLEMSVHRCSEVGVGCEVAERGYVLFLPIVAKHEL